MNLIVMNIIIIILIIIKIMIIIMIIIIIIIVAMLGPPTPRGQYTTPKVDPAYTKPPAALEPNK